MNIMKIFLLALFSAAFCIEISSMELSSEFMKFITNFDRQYETVEETVKRFKIFSENYKAIKEINAVDHDVELAVNEFADLTQEEFKTAYLRYAPTRRPCTLKHKKTTPVEVIDWRKKGAVNNIKNQGPCGSCWAFSAVCALEGLDFITNKKLRRFSEQELVDCSRKYGDNHGCKGGDMSQAFEYVKDNGISIESNYPPYVAKDMKCRKTKSDFKISGCVNVTHNSNKELLEALAIGPVSIAVKANNYKFMYYKKGIISAGCGTPKSELDHGIGLIGAGKEGDINYWIVRNSWGTGWGQDGYAFIKRDTADGPGVCGIAMENSYPVA